MGKALNGLNSLTSSPDVILTRISSSEEGTFGRLTICSSDYTCFSGELPYRDNLPNVSAIPVGTYKCVWSYSTRFKRNMYEITGVPKRAGVRIHAANLMGNKDKGFKAQLNGCVSLGKALGAIEGQKAVLLSKPAIREFETFMNGKTFILEIKDAV